MLKIDTSIRAISNGIDRAIGMALPTAIEYRFFNIPRELRASPRWSPFRFVAPSDLQLSRARWSKLPVDIRTREAGSSSDPRTWSEYGAACGYYLDHRDDEDPRTVAHGIGIMIDEPFVFVDLDHHVVEGTVDDFAEKIIADFDSYWETSVSGKGLHAIGRAFLPYGNRRWSDLGVEVYGGRRYCITTGVVLDGRSQIRDCQSAVDRLLAEANAASVSLDRQHNSRIYIHSGGNERREEPVPTAGTAFGKAESRIWAMLEADPKAAALMSGDQLGYPSPSNADAALIEKLLYYTDYDVLLTDRLFRNSGRYRTKWDERHGQNTYGARTIERITQWMRSRDITRRRTGRKPRKRGRPLSTNLRSAMRLLSEDPQLKPAELASVQGVQRLYAKELLRRAKKRIGSPQRDVDLNAKDAAGEQLRNEVAKSPSHKRVKPPRFEDFFKMSRRGPYRPARQALARHFDNIRRYAKHQAFPLQMKHLSDWWGAMLRWRVECAGVNDERRKRFLRKSLPEFLKLAVSSIDAAAGSSSFSRFRALTNSYYRDQDRYAPPLLAILALYLDCLEHCPAKDGRVLCSSAATVLQRLSRQKHPPLRLPVLRELIVARCRETSPRHASESDGPGKARLSPVVLRGRGESD